MCGYFNFIRINNQITVRSDIANNTQTRNQATLLVSIFIIPYEKISDFVCLQQLTFLPAKLLIYHAKLLYSNANTNLMNFREKNLRKISWFAVERALWSPMFFFWVGSGSGR